MMTLWRIVSRAVWWGCAFLGLAVFVFVGGCIAGVTAENLDYFLYGGALFAIAGFLLGGVYGAFSRNGK